MSFARHRTDIETDFIARFVVLQPLVPVTGENADIDNIPQTNTAWVRISLNTGDTFKNCIGQDNTQTNGIFNVQVFTPKAQGAAQASEILDSAIDVLRTASLNAIEFLDYRSSFVGDENGFYYNLLRANYRAFDN